MPDNPLWPPDAPSEDQPLDLLVYRSRLIGADPRLVVWGGGNTSTKTVEQDHLGRERQVLRIKGSGTDLKSIGPNGFPGIFIDEVLPLRDREDMTDEEMVTYLEHCLVDPRGIRPSIETLLHAFLPAKHIDHTHADAIVTLTNTANGRDVVRAALGDQVAWIPWRRPGFQLAKQVAELAAAEAVVLEKHGLVTWGETAEESFSCTTDLVRRAETWLQQRCNPSAGDPPTSQPNLDISTLLLKLRGRLGHRILRVWSAGLYRAISDREDIREVALAGPATADHVLRIRPWSCVIDRENPIAAIDAWEQRYRAFFAEFAGNELQMLDPLPKVLILPGTGIITVGKNDKDARITAEVALHTLQVAAAGKDAHGSYQAVSGRDLFDVEYWPLELYKLTLAPPPRELEGRIVVVTGAASGIGRAIARHLATLGAYLVLADVDWEGMHATAEMIRVESDGVCTLVRADVTDRNAVQLAIRSAISNAGGIDALVANAGIPAAGTLTDLDPDLWSRSLEINTTGHFLITAEVMRALETQGLGGSLVYIASKNAFGPGAGFGAYSVAKAGQVQLARIAALEGGAHGIRANIINPDAIFEDSKLWSEEIRRERAAVHGIPVEEIESFYAQRNLLKTTVTSQDVAEAAAFLLSDRSRATTGTVITVDGGVAAAFPR
jgi:rhamnulose-1-phosphate aldolase/alcohol dehydrogenase